MHVLCATCSAVPFGQPLNHLLCARYVRRSFHNGAPQWMLLFGAPSLRSLYKVCMTAFCVHSLEETEEALQARGITYNKASMLPQCCSLLPVSCFRQRSNFSVGLQFIVPGTKEGKPAGCQVSAVPAWVRALTVLVPCRRTAVPV